MRKEIIYYRPLLRFVVVFFSLGCLFLGIVPKAHASTYYVDSVGGSDSNNATSASTPWQTIAKVNSSTFNPGDNILFKAGDTWREQLNITNSGSVGDPIAFGSYGSGAAPIVSGANLATGWASTTVGVNASVVLAPTSTQYLQTPATTSNLLTGTNFALEVDLQLAAYNAAGSLVLMAKDNCCTATGRHWDWSISNSAMILYLWNGSSSSPSVSATTSLASLTGGVRYKLRAQVVPNNGTGSSTVTFFKSTDGITYTQMGPTSTAAALTVNNISTTTITVGNRADGGSGPSFTSTIYRARAWSDLTDTNLVLDMNPASATPGTSTFLSGGAT